MKAADMEQLSVEKIYLKYGKKLYRLAVSMVGQTDGEDVIQDVFSKLCRNLPSFGNEKDLEAWLVRVVINQANDSLRKQKIRTWEQIEDVKEENLSDYDKDKGRGKLVLEAVKRIPEKYRAVILLFYFEGYSIEEVGRILDLGTSAVKMRLVRGREAIKKVLEREGVFYGQ